MTRIIEAPPAISVVSESSYASAGIIVTPDKRFLLQLRDAKPGIWFPNSWSLFGGAGEPGETPGQAMLRELGEEIDLIPQEIHYFTQIAWDFAAWGLGVKLRYIFEVKVTHEEIAKLTLHEGQSMRLFTVGETLREPRLVPYDTHALRMYIDETPVGMAPRIA